MLTEQSKMDVASNMLVWENSYDHYTKNAMGGKFFGIVSDYYKGCFGFRPHGIIDKESAMVAIELCERYLARMKQTEEGRNTLRADGWLIMED